MLETFRTMYNKDAGNKAIRNAIAANSIDVLAVNAENRNNFDDKFSHRVESKGITNQKQSGRCWLFTGLNVLRSQMMAQHDLPELKLSQAYNFFYDQLEKSNLFLQGMIDNASKPLDDKMVQWLLKNPLSDGGQFTGVADNVTKYGVVPTEVMAESFSAENTARLNNLLSLKLREGGMELRKLAAKGNKKKLYERKEDMLKEIYRMLALSIGEPPVKFTWTRRDKDGKAVDTRQYTPQEFYQTYAGNDLQNGYVMLMNDPSRPFYEVYEIDYDRHSYDGKNWTYINLPIEEIKKVAIESIKDSTMMYFSCDVGKYLDRGRGLLDPNNFDYESLMGTTFGMDKADRIRTYASASSHAMTLMAVDLDENGKPVKWMVENSWGDGPNNGHLIMTDKWFDEYMFRLVADKKYVPQATLDLLKRKPIMLPAWDPMFLPEE
ncbi:MAG: C1 family peptidase [Prevotella sp.]|nr:C1 family peptidase [Prevotella sp.]